MSWPSDNLRRFVVAETRGYLTDAGGYGTSTGPGVSWAVLDRAYSHREIAVYRSEDFANWHGDRRDGLAQLQAEAKADELEQQLGCTG